MARLSSGKRINSASDAAAGVAISSRLTANIRGTDQAIRNALDGQALIDTAEGAHKEIENILQRMREVSVQAANDTNNAQDRANLQAEFDAMTTEINRIAGTTTWAGTKMLDDHGSDFSFHVGAGASDKDRIDVSIGPMTSSALGVGGSTTSGGNLIEITGVTIASGQFTALVDDNEVTDTGVTVTFDATDNALTVTGTATRAAQLEMDLSSASGNVLLTTVTLNIGDTQEMIAAAIKTAIDNVSSALAPVTATADTVAGTVTIDGADFEDVASETVDGFTIDLTSNVITVSGTANTNGTLTLDAAVSSTYDDGADVLVSYNNGDDAAAITNAIKAAIDDVVGSMTGGTTTLMSSSSPPSSSPPGTGTVNNAISGQGTNAIMAIPAQSGASGIDLVIGSVTVSGIDISTGDATAAAAAITSAINDGNGSPGSGEGTAAHGVTATDALDGAGNINLSFSGGATAGDVAAYVSGSGSSSGSGVTFSANELINNSFFTFPVGTQEISNEYIKFSWTEGYDHYRPNLLSFKPIEQQADLGGSLTLTYDMFRPTADDDHDPTFYISDGNNAVAWIVGENPSEGGHIGINPQKTDGNFFQHISSNPVATDFGWGTYSGKYQVQINYEFSGSEVVSSLSLIGANGERFISDLNVNLSDYQSMNLTNNNNISFGIIANHTRENYWIENLSIQAEGNELTLSEVISSSSSLPSSSPTLDSPSNAMAAITVLDTAIQTVNTQRSKLGAVSNRLTHTVNNLTNISANLSAARGGIEDADFALETTSLAKNQILQQASTAMLAQANASKQNVLSLLQG